MRAFVMIAAMLVAVQPLPVQDVIQSDSLSPADLETLVNPAKGSLQ